MEQYKATPLAIDDDGYYHYWVQSQLARLLASPSASAATVSGPPSSGKTTFIHTVVKHYRSWAKESGVLPKLGFVRMTREDICDDVSVMVKELKSLARTMNVAQKNLIIIINDPTVAHTLYHDITPELPVRFIMECREVEDAFVVEAETKSISISTPNYHPRNISHLLPLLRKTLQEPTIAKVGERITDKDIYDFIGEVDDIFYREKGKRIEESGLYFRWFILPAQWATLIRAQAGRMMFDPDLSLSGSIRQYNTEPLQLLYQLESFCVILPPDIRVIPKHQREDVGPLSEDDDMSDSGIFDHDDEFIEMMEAAASEGRKRQKNLVSEVAVVNGEDDDAGQQEDIDLFLSESGVALLADPEASTALSAKGDRKKRGKDKSTVYVRFNAPSVLRAKLEEVVLGQPEAVEQVVQGLSIPAAGVNLPEKPLRSMMFLGPTGVGKTKMAKAIAEHLYEEPVPLVRIDMGEYSDRNSASKLFGASPMYVGYGEETALVRGVKENPASVILLDEVEKADRSVWDSMLQVFDNGILTTGNGERIDMRGCVFLLTSNLGTAEASKNPLGFGAGSRGASRTELQRITSRALDEFFRPEFINRMDDVVLFNQLGEREMEEITRREISQLGQRISNHGYTLGYVTDKVVSTILADSQVAKFGARNIQRMVDKKLSAKVAAAMTSRVKGNYLLLGVDEADNVGVTKVHKLPWRKADKSPWRD